MLMEPKVLLVLIRIEPYFLIGFVITYGLINVHFLQPEFGLTMALVPALAIQVGLTIYFTRSENTFGAILAIVRPFLHYPKVRALTPPSAPANGRNGIPSKQNP